MKQAVISLIILSIITVCCALSSNKIYSVCKDLEDFVNELPERAEDVKLDEYNKAARKWEEDGAFLNFFVCAGDVIDVESSLQTIKNSVIIDRDDEFSAAKSDILARIKLIKEAQELKLENIF